MNTVLQNQWLIWYMMGQNAGSTTEPGRPATPEEMTACMVFVIIAAVLFFVVMVAFIFELWKDR